MIAAYKSATLLLAAVGVILTACSLVGCTDESLSTTEVGSCWMQRGVAADGTDISYEVDFVSSDGRVILIVAANGSQGSMTTTATSPRGHFFGPRGQQVSWLYNTKDGMNETVTVDGHDYKLKDGAMFLIRMWDTSPKVEQVSIDMSRLVSGGQMRNTLWPQIQQIVAGDQRLSVFFRECRGE